MIILIVWLIMLISSINLRVNLIDPIKINFNPFMPCLEAARLMTANQNKQDVNKQFNDL
jgi:hypothetical protein